MVGSGNFLIRRRAHTKGQKFSSIAPKVYLFVCAEVGVRRFTAWLTEAIAQITDTKCMPWFPTLDFYHRFIRYLASITHTFNRYTRVSSTHITRYTLSPNHPTAFISQTG